MGPSWEGKPILADSKAHIPGILNDWADPIPRFIDATDFGTQIYRWEMHNRFSINRWSSGRIMYLGDTVHPVSSYTIYKLDEVIKDGYYLARALDGLDLREQDAVSAGFEILKSQRIEYINFNTKFARFPERMFHSFP